jgi:DNA-binding response OmpR family regulator
MRSTAQVLLVDDIPDHTSRYAAALRSRGFGIMVCESGGEALDAARRSRPHCIVIDERISDMRGWELCREFKRDAQLSVVPIIVLAQELTIAAAARGQRVGCDAWLARPARPEDLVRAVEDVIASPGSTPATPQDALVGYSTCGACASPRIRGGVRVGPVQYHVCGDCGFRWRTDAAGEATA